MATGPSYRVPFRRRREGKTDYQLRRGLILSGLPRLVIRGSLRNLTAQMVKAEPDGDKVVACAYSSELAKKYGWLGDTGNLSAAYLTGLLCGFRAGEQGIKNAVLDIGVQFPSKGSRIFAALKGALDAGITIPFDKERLPDEKRIAGQHIVEHAKLLSSNPEAYQRRFSVHLARGLKPEEINAHFVQVKETIISSSKKATSPKEVEATPSAEEKQESKPQETMEEE